MPKQLSLFFQDEQQMKIITSIGEEKKREAISALKELVIAYIKTQVVKEGSDEK